MERLTTITINYQPHPGQFKFHNSSARYRCLTAGRRFGKTTAGANEAIKQSIKRGPHSEGFIVGPTFAHTEQCWEEILQYLPPELIQSVHRRLRERRIILHPHRVMWFKSADSPDSLRSKGIDWGWLDEAGLINRDAWNALRPGLMDRGGLAWFTGTPKGHTLFYDVWLRGQDRLANPDYESWSFPSGSNPYLNPAEIEAFKRDMPERVFSQEINAVFMENVGSVFRNLSAHVAGQKECPIKTLPLYHPGENVVVGVDLARTEDFTVLIALRENGDLIGFDRFQQIDWPLQRRRIINFAIQHGNARVLLDASGLGDPVLAELTREYGPISGFKFTNQSKAELIENLSMMLENSNICLAENPVLLNEMDIFGYKHSAGGTISYGAPEGYHDDCVIALALAAWQLHDRVSGPVGARFLPFRR